MKYLIRAEKKNGLEDYKKAKTYLDWFLKECEEEKQKSKAEVKNKEERKNENSIDKYFKEKHRKQH